MLLGCLIGACASDDSGDSASDDEAGDSTTTSAPADAIDFAEPGPYPVGVVDFTVDENKIAVFYPGAVGEEEGLEQYTYSGAELFGPELADLLPGAFGDPQTVDNAYRDLPVTEDGPFPILLSSHGFGGYYRFSGKHNAAVASWGFVVVAVDHPQRGTLSVFTGASQGGDTDVDQLLAALEYVDEQGTTADSVLEGLVDPEQVAVEGHSAGGSAAGQAAYDPRIDTWIGMAPGPPASAEDLAAAGGREAFDPAAFYADHEPPDKPSMIIAADNDFAISLDRVEQLFEWLPTPRRLAVVENSGHGVFVDICLPIQEEGGLAEVVTQLGFDPAQVPLVQLGEDGCLADDAPAGDVFELTDHLTVAQLRFVFGIDETQAAASLERSYLDEQFPGLLEDYRVED